MQDDVIDIEGNMTVFRKIKTRPNQGEKDKRKQREEASTSSLNKDSQDAKIEEMSRIIKQVD